MMALCWGMILVPASFLIIWFMTPIFKDIMVSVVETWGAVVGLSGFALLIADMMPIIVPLMCFAGIIAGIIGLTKGRSSI